MDLGEAIRARRSELGITLEELAQRSAVSRAMLSDVERGRKSPTIRVACQIAEGLETTVSDLLGEERRPRAAVLRRDARRPLIDPKTGIERHVLSDMLLGHGLEVVWYVIPAGESTGAFPPHRPGVFEHITVVHGTLQATLGGEQMTLNAGDSASYRADVRHAYRNPGRERCEYFLVIDSSRLGRSAG